MTQSEAEASLKDMGKNGSVVEEFDFAGYFADLPFPGVWRLKLG